MMSDVKLRMKPAVAVEKLDFQRSYKSKEKQQYPCSDKPKTEEHNFYKEVMYELVKLRQELETEREMRQKLESKVSRQSQTIKKLKVKTPSKENTLKNPSIRLEIGAGTKGKYISAVDDSDSSNAFSPNFSDAAAEDVEPESCDELPIEDAALSTDGFHLHKSTHLSSLANTNKVQAPVTDYERMQLSGRQSSKEKNLTFKCNLPAFDDSVPCAKNKDNSSRKRRASQEQLQTNSENSPKKLRHSFDIGVLSSSSLITSREGVYAGILDTGIKLPQPIESTACAKKADKRTGSVLKGSEYISVYKDPSLETTLVGTSRRRGPDELCSEITHDSRVRSKTNVCVDQSCCDDGNNRVTRNATTDSNISRNHDKQWQISEGKSNKKLTKGVKKDGCLLPLSNLDLVGERHTLCDSGSYKRAEHEVIKLSRKNEHLGNQSNFGLDNDYSIASESCSRIQSFTEITSCGKTKTLKTANDLMHQSRSDLVDENDSLIKPRSRDHDTQLKFSKTKTSNNLKLAEMNKCNSNSPSINCTKEDRVLSTIERTRSISPECKTKNPCKSSLDYSYGCNLCGLKFSGMESLRCHMPCVRSVTNKDPLKCGVCSKTFRESVALERHLQGLHTNKLFKCEICSKNCTSKSCLAWHMQTHVDVEPENCKNQSNALLSIESQASQKSSDCTICSKKFFSKRCLQSHMKLHKGNEAGLLPSVSDDCQPENPVILVQSLGSQEPMNRSFQDALGINKLLTANLVSKQTELLEENSRRDSDRERSSLSIFDQNRLLCDSGSSLPIDVEQNKTRSRQQNLSSVSIFDRMSSVIASGQKESTELTCAQESSSEIKKAYRPYCVKCWNTFKDLHSLEEHAKSCNESCRESSPIATIPIHLNECIITVLEDRLQSSECVLENISEEKALKSFEAVADNHSADVVESNTFEEFRIGSDSRGITNLHDSIDEEDKNGLDEVDNCESHDRAKTSLDALTRVEPNVPAKYAADDMANSESDDLAESFSEDVANIESSYLANSESDILDLNGLDKVANGKSGDLIENVSDDLGRNGSDESVEDTPGQVTKSVLGKVTENQPSNLGSSGSNKFLRSRFIDSTKGSSDGVATDSSRVMNFVKRGSQKLTKSVLHEVSNCLSGDGLRCLECRKVFSSRQKLNKHMELHKLFGSSLHCSRCKHKFTILDSVQEHTCHAYTIEGPQFKCPECEKGFEISLKLKKHMRKVHSVEQHFKCKHCGMQYETFGRWNNHVQAHRTDRHYVCNKCGSRYKFLHHLKTWHLPCLSKSTELKCPKCDQKFVKASRLRHHVTLCQNERAVKCRVCHQLFKNQPKLDKHICRHARPYLCPLCDNCFIFRENLIRHVHHHSVEKAFDCVVCDKSFAVEALLLSHLKVHTISRKKLGLGSKINGKSSKDLSNKKYNKMSKGFYGCGLCGCLYMTMISLRCHLPCKGGACEKDPFFCGECNEKFCDENELEKHIASVHSENHSKYQYDAYLKSQMSISTADTDNRLDCLNCLKTFRSHQQLNRHLELHKQFGNSLRCSHCKQKFTHLDLTEGHTCQAYTIEGPQFRCPECEESFEIYLQFKNHMSDVHSVEQQFKCKHCGKQYETFCLWKNHIQVHRTDRHYVCNKCGKKYKFLHHLKTNHLPCLSDSTELKCPKCNEEFVKTTQLRIHFQLCQNVRAVKCLVCNKLLSSQAWLKKHMRSHASEKPYQCPQCCKHFTHALHHKYHLPCYVSPGSDIQCNQCPKSFCKISHLRTHISVDHSSNAAHCEVSGKKFLSRRVLDVHLKSHQNDRNTPYSCAHCSKGFVHISSLKHHLETVHLNILKGEVENVSFHSKYDANLNSQVYPSTAGTGDEMTGREPNDLASMLPVLAKNAADDQANSESDDLAGSFSEEMANNESYLANSESDLLDLNGLDKVANGKSDDLIEKVSDDLVRNGSDESVEDASRQVIKSVLGKVTENQPNKLISSGSNKFLRSRFIDSTKGSSDGVATDSSRVMNFVKRGSQKLTKSVLHEVSNCLSDDGLRCLECCKVFSSRQKLNKHMELHKLFGSSLHCSRCKQKFTILDSVQEHTCHAYTIEGPQFKCPECEKGFEISLKLKKHMRKVHSVEQHFKCKHCGKQYETFSRWNNHVQAHRTDRHYVCNKCGSRYKFLYHLKTWHLPCLSKSTELKCPKCDQRFAKASRLRHHVILCQNERAVKCRVCHQLFKNQPKLDKHMCRHAGERPYLCPLCDNCFIFRENLIRHVHQHSVEKPYVCVVCDKAFAVEGFLLCHLKVHTTSWKNLGLGSKINGKSSKVLIDKEMSKIFYGCGLCGCLYMTMISLRYHLPCKGGAGEKDPFFCGECNEKFCEENELEKHVASVHSENLFSCSICNKMFVKELYLKLHIMHSHAGENPYNCKLCCNRFKHALELKYHLPCYVSPGSDIQCNQCEMTFCKISQLRTHIIVDHSNKAALCDVCGKKFRSHHMLDIHLKSHENYRNKPYSCSQCSVDFVRISSLTHHLETVHLNPLKGDAENKSFQSEYDANLTSQITTSTAGTDAFYCLLCFEPFPRRQQLNEHLELHKQFGSSLCCSRCKHKFTRLDLIQEHICQAYTIEGPKFRCPECEASFEIFLQFKNHMSDVHSVEQHFKCKHCGKQYEKFSKWKNHIRVHRTDRHYVCNKCGKRYKFLHHLKKDHLPCLSDSTELKCPKCNEEFVKTTELRNHFKLCQNVQAVKCLVCNQLFSSQSNLDNHMRCHTSEKPYHCQQCEKCFSCSEGLLSHAYNHSAEKLYVCDVCSNSFAVKRIFIKHYISHMNRKEKCSIGIKINVASNQVQRRETSKQMQKRFYGCGLCGCSYMGLRSLKHHYCTGGTGEKDPFFCGECNEKFVDENELQKHVASVHSENLFSCSICNKMFVKELYLKQHIMYLHTGKDPYKCKQCCNHFKHSFHLKYHLPCYVSPGSDIQCDRCPKTFCKISQLRTHISFDHGRNRMQCDVCGKKCHSRQELDVHLKSHENYRKKPYSCTHCSKGFVQISVWKHHFETVHLNSLKSDAENNSFHSEYHNDAYLKSQISLSTAGTDDALGCLNCLKTFRSHQQLNRHLELHKQFGNSLHCGHCKQKFTRLDLIEGHACEAYTIEGPQFRCPECEESFEIYKQFKKHMSDVHSMEQHFKCKRCGKQYETFSQWKNHIQVHRTDRNYVCNKCGKRYKFLQHLKINHLPCLSDFTELKCPKCNEEFIKITQLRNHFKLCQNKRAVKCLVCQRLFDSQSKLDKHIPCLVSEKPYQCPQCNKCFSVRLRLTNHLLVHSGVKPYACDICGKAFAVEAFLQRHSRIHTTNRLYKCNECDMSFIYACHLRYHKAKVHSGVRKRFACSICNKSFFSKTYLNAHMCSHTGQNPYVCSVCGKGFPAKELLKYHLRVHTGERPYACQYCYRRFSMPRSMRNHERVHTGEKPYECTICGMKFSQSSYLKNHSKKAHMAE